MSRNRREHGRIISVESKTRGDALAEDAAAGATSITVEDAGDFDEDGGWLLIGGQVIGFSECDDDTGVITLVTALAAAAEQGDPVQVWSDLYEEVVEYQQALVELDGEYDNPDPVVAEVAEGVADLPEGDRGKAGESCTLLRVGEDEWEVVGVGGRPRQSQGFRWEANDAYVLTAADITAGVATCPLSHQPDDEAVDARWRTTPQEPTEYTVNGDQTITWPLSGFEAAGDRLWFHYTYHQGIATATIVDVPTIIGSASAYRNLYDFTTFDLPAGTEIGDTIYFVSGGATVTDSRLTRIDPTVDFWVGTATTLDPIAVAGGANSTGIWYSAQSAMTLRGGSGVLTYTLVDLPSGQTTVDVPSVTGSMIVSMASSGFGTVDGSVYRPSGFTSGTSSASGKASTRIDTWATGAASPATTITRDGDVGGGSLLLARVA